MVVALALAAVFGSMSLANPAQAQATPVMVEVYTEHERVKVDLADHLTGTFTGYAVEAVAGKGTIATINAAVGLYADDVATTTATPLSPTAAGPADPTATPPVSSFYVGGLAAGLQDGQNEQTFAFEVTGTTADTEDTDPSVVIEVKVMRSVPAAPKTDEDVDVTLYTDHVMMLNASDYFTPGTGSGAVEEYGLGTVVDVSPARLAAAPDAPSISDGVITVKGGAAPSLETETITIPITATAIDGTTLTAAELDITVARSMPAMKEGSIADMDAEVGTDPVEIILGDYFMSGMGTGMITGYSATSEPRSIVSVRIGMVNDDMDTPEDTSDDMMVQGLLVRPLAVGYTTVVVTAMDDNDAVADPTQEFVFEVTAVETVEPPAPDPVHPTIKASSYNPGKNARYTIEFNASQQYVPGVHDLVVQLTDEDFQVPDTISTSAVTIQAGYNVANPNDVSVDDQEITLVLGDMDPDADGVQAIGMGQNVTIIFRTAAGIANPEEGGGYGGMSVDGQDLLWADGEMNANGMPTDKEVSINRTISLSEDEGGRGDEIMVTGKGFKNGTSVTFLRMESDSVKPADFAAGTGLCVAEASNGVATCSFTVTSPLFQHGDNFINGIDGRSNMGNESEPFDLEPSISVNPSAGSPGESLLVQLYDFGPGATVENVKIARRTLCRPVDGGAVSLMTVCAQGYSAWVPSGLSFRVVIPNDAPLGRQDLQVNTTDGSDNTNITITGPLVTSTPSTVLANQRVSLVGNGFTPSSTLREITFAGTTIDSSRINDGLEVRIDGGGNWNASVNLPLNTSTVSAGEHTVQIEDMGGRTGTLKVTVPEREVTITPSSGRVGTIAVVRGENFPSRNEEGNSFNVQIVYGSGDASSTTVSTVPDASGRFEAQMRIPTTSAIPSTNDVSVSFGSTQNGGPWTINVSHDVPEGIITLSATSGGPGSGLNISGEGFRSFVPVNSVMIGSIDITPTPRPSSDANGMVSFDVVVPGLDVGIQTIEVQVGKTTASAGFTVTESGVNPGDITAVMAAVEPLGDNLVSAWNFNNDTKVWSFYDPTLTEGNTLTHMITGETYLIRIKTDAEVILNRDTRNLTCVGDNCWNQIVW